MTVPQLAVLLAASACFASYFWGLLRFFRQPGGQERDIRLIKIGTTLALWAHVAVILLFYRHATWRFAAALALYGAALALYWWCIRVNRARPLSIAFSDDVPVHITAAGPYAAVRHPLYASYMLCWTAGTLATGQPLLALTVVGMGWLYHRAALKEEAKFAASPLARDYARYAARTKRYLPGLF